MPYNLISLALLVMFAISIACAAQEVDLAKQPSPQRVRFATFNTALHRAKAGLLVDEVKNGRSQAIAGIAEVIQRVRPDVILLTEVDYDEAGAAVEGLRKNYLMTAQNGQAAIDYPHVFFAAVNTGEDSKLDLNRDGKSHSPDDAFGFGLFPGQYGMALLSRFPISPSSRTFQKFLWRDMPGALWPTFPETKEEYYSAEIKQVFRLSSKSHWYVPIQISDRIVHVIAAHPTPPIFDQKEDRNGRRNHDEIRLIADYLSGADYIYDDKKIKGGLTPQSSFVVAGDLNSDPADGESWMAAVRQLIDHPLVDGTVVPTSAGAKQASEKSGQINVKHTSDSAADTGDFNDKTVGNLRLDYVLPSKDLNVVGSGVFWPTEEDPNAPLAKASDHHLVWIDVEF